MHYLTILPLLLAPLAAASPAAAALSARDDSVTIFDSPYFRGQHREIPVNGLCVNLGPPFYPGQDIQSLRFSAPSGDNCAIHRTSNCRDTDPVVYFESQQRIRIRPAYSIQCAKNARDSDYDE